ncbi:MAG: RNA polymerase sigma factor [Anaerolineales bacterium]|nr:RNA polymerase sigma factor [Anaerolineales bacterium]
MLQADIDDLLRNNALDASLVLERIMSCYQDAVYRLAFSILDDPDEAHDAMQETFLTVAYKLHQYQIGTHFRAWLFSIAVNTCRGHLRKRRARDTLKQVWTTMQSLVSAPVSPEESAIRSETHAQLWKAVDALHDRHRIPLVLRIVHECSVHEIAQILEIPEKTVYTRLYDAYEKVRHQLNELEPLPNLLTVHHEDSPSNRF